MEFCDCAEKCKSKEHGKILCTSMTKRDITDAELCAYFNQICFCCEAVRDDLGRTALHLAASVGRANVVKWLLRRKQININARDFESGYTALHRSIFYGKINAAVALLHAGASNVLDHENLTCLDHAMKNYPFSPNEYIDGEVYVWGSNSNYILGIQQARQTPDIWDIFHKEYTFELVKQISLGKFHCIVITGNGNAYSCGHGQGGRLGLGSEQTMLTPKQIKFADTRQSSIYCIQASIARDHTVFLTDCDDTYQIWSCGLNTHHVLGINPPPQKQLTPKRLSHFKHMFFGVCAARYHSVAWGPKAIYTWGLHGGQLGHDQNTQKYITIPKLITRLYKMKSDIQDVVVSSGATVVLMTSGDIFVFHEYQCRILSPRQKLTSISVVGGRLNTSLDTSLLVEKNSELKVLALTQHGKILLWQESDPNLVRCVFSLNREISATQIYMNTCEILFVDNEGEAFQGTLKNRKKKSGESSSAAARNTFHRFVERDECHFVKITKLPRIHRAIYITSDSKGGNFAIIQAHPKARLSKLPEAVVGILMLDLRNLLEESDEEDFVHDVIFKVGLTLFPAHRYIIASCNSNIQKLLSNDKIVEINDVHPDIFKELLLWIYTGDCSLLIVGPCPKHLLKVVVPKVNNGALIENIPLNPSEEAQDLNEVSAFEYYKKNKNNKEATTSVKDAIRLLQDLAKKFEISDLEKRLSKLTIRNGHIVYVKSYSEFYFVGKKTFNRFHSEDLYDVNILTKGNHTVQAHKCMLVARVDFFQKMYSSRWHSKAPKMEVQMHYQKNVVETFLEYLYTDNIANPKALDFDTLCSLLILSDEYFIVRLREICEITLCNLLSFKNAVQLLTIASLYNAEKLKIVIMKFICLNLCAFLETKSLENLEDDLLDKLTNLYCKYNKKIQTRIITPYSTAPSDEDIRNISNMYPISLDIDEEFEIKNKSTPKIQRKRLKSHKTSLSESKPDNLLIDNAITEKVEEVTMHWVNDSQDVEGATCDSSQKSVPVRIQAITKAHEQIQNEDYEPPLVKLTSPQSDSNCSVFETSYQDFPLLNSPSTSSYSKSPVKSERVDKHKITRVSQKQRKRLSSEGNIREPSTSESPKNPWKINELSTPIGSPEQETNLCTILMEEKKQRENFNKMMTKSLVFTQIEDKAMEDLQKFYNSSNCHEEVITTERVSNGCLSTPVWVHKSK